MRALLGLILTASTLALSTGCSVLSPQKPIHISSQAIGNNGDLYSLPANLRLVDVRGKDASYIICPEPAPDIAMSNALKLALDASEAQSVESAKTSSTDSASGKLSNSIGIKGNYDAATTALALAGRTQIVLLARDFAAGNCRARSYGWITNEQFKETQGALLTQITSMITAEQARAEADKANANAVEAAVKAVVNPEAVSNVRNAVNKIKIEACLKTYETCVSTPNADANKCKADFLKCSE